MERWVSDLIATVIILLMVGGFSTLIAGLAFRHKRLMKADHSADLDQVRDELAQLREDANAQLAELHERVDFAERLLAQTRNEPPPLPRQRTPI